MNITLNVDANTPLETIREIFALASQYGATLPSAAPSAPAPTLPGIARMPATPRGPKESEYMKRTGKRMNCPGTFTFAQREKEAEGRLQLLEMQGGTESETVGDNGPIATLSLDSDSDGEVDLENLEF